MLIWDSCHQRYPSKPGAIQISFFLPYKSRCITLLSILLFLWFFLSFYWVYSVIKFVYFNFNRYYFSRLFFLMCHLVLCNRNSSWSQWHHLLCCGGHSSPWPSQLCIHALFAENTEIMPAKAVRNTTYKNFPKQTGKY